MPAPRKILVAGNGGSSSDADHFVCELTCTFDNRKRKAISAISLNNPTALSAWSNDFSYETFLERQIKALGQDKDLYDGVESSLDDLHNVSIFFVRTL